MCSVSNRKHIGDDSKGYSAVSPAAPYAKDDVAAKWHLMWLAPLWVGNKQFDRDNDKVLI